MHTHTIINRLALAIANPLQRRTARSRWIEQKLDMPLSDSDHERIARALERDQKKLGHYYHWYLEKALVARVLRSATRERMLATAESADRTDYTQLDRIVQGGRGVVLAIPHFGHYILALGRLLGRYSTDHDIGVVYASPTTNTGNSIFDFIQAVCFQSDAQSRLRVMHANRAGLTDAMKLLRSGGVVLMLPDVCLVPEEGYRVPFLGRTFDAMLGSASLARRTKSALVPCLAAYAGNLAFQLRYGEPIATNGSVLSPTSPHFDLANDYHATARMFALFEKWMAGHTYMWQPIREHFVKSAPFPNLTTRAVEKVWPSLRDDPRMQPYAPTDVIELEAA